MGSIQQRGSSWRAIVRKEGVSVTKTFPKKKLASSWIRTTEEGIVTGKYRHLDDTNFGVLCKRVLLDMVEIKRATKQRPLGDSTVRTIEAVRKSLGDYSLDQLTKQVLTDYGVGRGVKPSTVARDFSHISVVLDHAQIRFDAEPLLGEFQLARKTLKKLGVISESDQRDRRATDEEIDLIDAHKGRTSYNLGLLARFSVLTAMRAGEQMGVKGIMWSDLHDNGQTVLIRQRKHPKKARDELVPLLPEAQDIIEVMRMFTGKNKQIFPFSPNSVSNQWRKSRNRAAVIDLRWHDLRHEGVSRLFERGFDIMAVSRFSGHKDLNTLKRYTHVNPLQILESKGYLKT